MNDFHKPGFVNVDRMVEQIALTDVFDFFGQMFPEHSDGNNIRIECPITDCEPSSYGKLSVATTPPYRIKCHSCGVSGNVFTLMHILKQKNPPTGGRLRGGEFNAVKQDLVALVSGTDAVDSAPPAEVPAMPTPAVVEPLPEANIPLAQSDSERIRAMVNLHQKGTIDFAAMPPATSLYFRQRPYLTPEICKKWNMVYLPMGNGTLQGQIIYPVNNVAGDRLAWVGRDAGYDKKHQQWRKQGGKQEPTKFRFPSEKFFRRGQEFFGQEVERLQQDGYHEAIQQTGVLVVEGMNDVIALDALGQPAIAAMSNRLTQTQVHKVVTWAQRLANGKVTVMFDGDTNGREGAKESVWQLSQKTAVQSIVLPENIQPEHLSEEQWSEMKAGVRQRWQPA